MGRVTVVLLISLSAWGEGLEPMLAMGSPAAGFELPRVNGKTHAPGDGCASPSRVVLFSRFESSENPRPIAPMYGERAGQPAAHDKDRDASLGGGL